MGRIAEVSIQQVIAACDIVDVVSTYFPLKRAGTSFKANCPFHNEKSPSFHVNPSRGTFHCFGCGEGGNAIGFVMKYESLPFVDTVRKLASKYGITLIEEAGTPEQEAAAGRRVKLLALYREIGAWFHQLSAGVVARGQCHDRRVPGAGDRLMAFLTPPGSGRCPFRRSCWWRHRYCR